jgi:hypothetical protein
MSELIIPPLPLVLDQQRPRDMTMIETVLWEACSAASLAAYDRLCSEGADRMSPAALDALTLLDAELAAQPHVERLASSPYMRSVLSRMLSLEGASAGRTMLANVIAHSTNPGRPS